MGGSDKRLVKRAVRGDGRAFEEIYRRYGQDLYRFCLAMTGNHQDAQDALQNTMVKVLCGLPGEERQIVLKPWLYRIARNETIDVLRKRRDNEELGVAQTDLSSVAETAEIREHLRMLLSDLEQLPQRQRAVLLMRELSGLGFTEIGIAFGTSAAAVRQTLYEARLSLQQLQEGRERRCVDVQRELSDADGRVIRRRKTRSHLHSCRECRAFHDKIVRRQRDLAALTGLPLVASAGLLRDVLSSQAGGIAGGAGMAGSGAGVAIGGGAGNAIATSAVVKSAAALAVAALAVSAADRGDLIHPSPRGGDKALQRSAEVPGQSSTGLAKTVSHAGESSARDAEETLPGAGYEVDRQRDPAGAATPADAWPTAPGKGKGENEATPAGGSGTSGATDDDFYVPSRAAENPENPEEGGQSELAAENDSDEGTQKATSHGQQMAAARKAEHAASPRGHGAAASKPGKPPHGGGPPAKSAAPSAASQAQLGESEAPPVAAEPYEPSEDSPAEQSSPPGHSDGDGHGHAYGHKS